MANGVVERRVLSDGTTYIKFESGFMMAWGSRSVSATTQNGLYGYRGEATIDLSPYGFTNIIVCFSNVLANAAWWNCTATRIDNTSKTFLLTVAGSETTAVNAQWFAAGMWR